MIAARIPHSVMQKPTIEVLICSCDKYDDVWRPFFTLFFRYWPDCPYRVNLMANERRYNDPRVRTLATDAAADWSTSLLQALRQIEAPYVLLLVEDYLLQKPVETARIAALCAIAMAKRAACFHVYPDPRPRERFEGVEGVGCIKAGAPFRVNTQAALWEKNYLMNLLKPGESGWDFEINATARSHADGRLYLSVDCAKRDAPLNYLCTGVVRGKWMPDAVRLCRREGVSLDLTRRKVGWARGVIRACPLLLPARRIVVSCKRRMGIN